MRIAVHEFWGLAANDAVEGGDTLLPIKEEFNSPGAEGAVAFGEVANLLCFGFPNEEAADGVPSVEGSHQIPNLIAVPNVAPLELRKGNAAHVDLVKNGT